MPFYVRLWQSHFILYFSAVMFIIISLLILQHKTKWFYKTTTKNSCATKQYTLQMEDRKKIEHLLLGQGHSREPNVTAVSQFRAELRNCYNATFSLVLTKENTPLGMKYVTSNGTFTVKAKLAELLPKSSPFLHSQYDHCAVVGNSKILHNSSCGQKIDQADLIIRFNLPPLDFPEDVGTKTSLVTISPIILKKRYKSLEFQRKPFVDALQAYPDAVFLIPDFFYKENEEVSYRAVYTMEDAGLIPQAFFLNPLYQTALGDYWKKKCFPHHLSSGFTLVSVALEVCQHITLYGFWPFPYDPASHSSPLLWEDTVQNGVSATPSEFSYYLHMYHQGMLRLQVGKCQRSGVGIP